ncbi:hypothetical protein GOOTI_004_00330 [Gordonia otitidis NBRC 100426]|uniref:Uncharacterized protein n=1 Tax=Gordonia otitidis (strain DSM 44809 / CCUG 52243 / JCM 12355 / NBRC 100426 / IFM 10032) TaxID=1108044 RepID=H5TFP8_GORO1|nr:hypothetical protein GOOTI_004_00330 [Gordonia otitidis NBRC 100426]
MVRSDIDVEARFDLEQLESAPDSVECALQLVTHDRRILEKVHIDTWWHVDAGGCCGVNPPATMVLVWGRQTSRRSTLVGAARRPADMELTRTKDALTAAQYRSALPL